MDSHFGVLLHEYNQGVPGLWMLQVLAAYAGHCGSLLMVKQMLIGVRSGPDAF